MGKIWIEVCMISARGLRRKSSLWKLQWFGVGWINPTNKYCTNIDASSGNSNPVWKTKFSTLIDTSEINFQELVLHVEVYSREPIFLREKLIGTATVALKEFVDKYAKDSQILKPIEQVGSFQLRKAKNSSNKPQGFVDISIRISAESEHPISDPGDQEGFKLDSNSGITLPNQYETSQTYNPQMPPTSYKKQEIQLQPRNQYTNHQVPYPTTYSGPSVAGPSYAPASGPSYQPPRTPPPPPPPPANVGYIPTFLPGTSNLPPSYVNMPSSGGATGRANGPGFGMGVGAGALAAGAVIFGDDFMKGFDFPGGLQDASIRISTDPPF